METKVCKKCGQELPISEFYADKLGVDGLKAVCKECYMARQKELKLSKVKDAPKVESNVVKECKENNLENVPARLLISELRRRGYRGKLELVTVQEVVI
jgi:protein-arginine kinase activator protein McsA